MDVHWRHDQSASRERASANQLLCFVAAHKTCQTTVKSRKFTFIVVNTNQPTTLVRATDFSSIVVLAYMVPIRGHKCNLRVSAASVQRHSSKRTPLRPTSKNLNNLLSSAEQSGDRSYGGCSFQYANHPQWTT